MTPDISLAFAVQSSPGVYALLLGSGVSRAAHIPTGWEVTLDLVRKLAAVEGADCGSDPAAWYENAFESEPEYSKLLNELAKTPAERQRILRSYFEPTGDEIEQGVKSPTKAHRAIARLMASGYVRLVLTTNFDRLLERAVEEAGVAPVVISTADQIAGAPPLAHLQNCIVKLHGDYLDTRILNTPEELAKYDPRMDRFLDRVLDEFGLIACGWSADWDTALCAAIERTPNRRYSTYFAAKGNLGKHASALIKRRGGEEIPIVDADSFFSDLEQKVEAITDLSQSHPLSVKAAVATCKRYLADPKVSRIRLTDLVTEEARRVCEKLAVEPFTNTGENATTETVTRRVRQYEGLCETLCAMAFEIGRYGDSSAVSCIANAQRRLHNTRSSQGLALWLDYQGYPVTLLTYSAMLGASIDRRCDVAASLLTTKLETRGREPILAISVVPPFLLLNEYPRKWGQLLEGKQNNYTPLNEWIADLHWLEFGSQFASKTEFELQFDWIEIIMAVAYHKLCPPIFNLQFHPLGPYKYRNKNREQIFQEIKSSLETQGDKSPYVRTGLFGKSAEEVAQGLTALDAYVSRLNWW